MSATGLSGARILAVLIKEFIQLTRDRLTYAMILVMPIVQLLLFGYAINNDPRNLPTAVLVQDHGPMARSTLSALANSGYFRIVAEAASPEDLDRAIARGEAQFALTIPADFTRRVVRGDGAQILVEADATDPVSLNGAITSTGEVARQTAAHLFRKDGIEAALNQPPEDGRRRMRAMRRQVFV